MEISKCFIKSIDEPVLVVHNKKILEIVRTRICKYWGTTRKLIFPGVQPVSIERKDLLSLISTPYTVCAKLDGERYFFYSTIIDSNRLQFLINRNFDVYIVDQNFANLCGDTLLDGELIDNQFVIHDSIVVNGKNVMNFDWDSRWMECDSFLNVLYSYDKDLCSFRICFKKFYKMNQINQLFNDMEKEKIKNDGIVMYPINDPVGYRTQFNLFKWKYKHTIDFQVSRHGKEYFLYCFDKHSIVKFGSVPEESMLFLQPLVDNQIVEFVVESNNTFTPMKIRNDKSTCNSFFTASKTVLNKMENITHEELIGIFNQSDSDSDSEYVRLEY
jgi:hypothetical protein